MIQELKMIPEYYIKKIPMCDNCNNILTNTRTALLSYPQRFVFKCDMCSKVYNFTASELEGEWKWKNA